MVLGLCSLFCRRRRQFRQQLFCQTWAVRVLQSSSQLRLQWYRFVKHLHFSFWVRFSGNDRKLYRVGDSIESRCKDVHYQMGIGKSVAYVTCVALSPPVRPDVIPEFLQQLLNIRKHTTSSTFCWRSSCAREMCMCTFASFLIYIYLTK